MNAVKQLPTNAAAERAKQLSCQGRAATAKKASPLLLRLQLAAAASIAACFNRLAIAGTHASR
jgi:hypothetical protein